MIIYSRSQKDNLKQVEAQEEQRLIRGQKEYLELEIRRFRRKKLTNYQNLERELLQEVMYFILTPFFSLVIVFLC